VLACACNPSTQEAEPGGSWVQTHEVRLCLKKNYKGFGSVFQEVEHLPSKCPEFNPQYNQKNINKISLWWAYIAKKGGRSWRHDWNYSAFGSPKFKPQYSGGEKKAHLYSKSKKCRAKVDMAKLHNSPVQQTFIEHSLCTASTGCWV
jgi:hypothetical protein